jgi:hypothetical protein
MLFAMSFARDGEAAGLIKEKNINTTIQQAREQLGYPRNKDVTRKTAKLLN